MICARRSIGRFTSQAMCFSRVRLVAAGLPLWNELSLFDESRRNCERALSEHRTRSGFNDPPETEAGRRIGRGLLLSVRRPEKTIALFETAIQLARDIADASVECRASVRWRSTSFARPS